MMQWLAPFFTYHFYTGGPGDSILYAVAMSMVVFLAATLLEFAVAIAGKWLIAGRLAPGRYPLWGLTYFRWWLADRLVDAAPTYFISGSSLQAWWLRALGARIGSDVSIGSIKLRAPDLFKVGDGASIGNAVNFENVRVQCGELLIGRIEIGAEAHIGSYAVLEGNTRVGDWGHLDGQSALADGQTVPAGRIWSGSPARDTGAFDAAALRPRPPVSKRRRAGEGLFFFGGAMVVAALFFLPVFPTFMLIDVLDDTERFPWLETSSTLLQLFKYFVLALPAGAVMIVLTALISAGIRWSVLPRLKSGSWPVHSNVYCGKWLVNQIQESSLQVLHGVYATLFAPMWYRLLGAKVGRNAEISTALGVVPDMLTLGDDTFIADAVLLGDEEIDGGWMTMRPTVISRRSFVGNGAYLPDGTTLPENVLIGVLGRAPDPAAMRSGDTWIGSPALRLPAREVVTGHAESLTFNPSPARRLGRAIVEAFRIVAPHAMVIAAGYSIVLAVMPSAAAEHWGSVVGYLTIDGLIFGLSHLRVRGDLQVALPASLPAVRGADVDTLRLALRSCDELVRRSRGAQLHALSARHTLVADRLQSAGRAHRPRCVSGHDRLHRVRLRAHRRLQRTQCTDLSADPPVRGPRDEDPSREHRRAGEHRAAQHRAVRRDRERRGPTGPHDAGHERGEHSAGDALERKSRGARLSGARIDWRQGVRAVARNAVIHPVASEADNAHPPNCSFPSMGCPRSRRRQHCAGARRVHGLGATRPRRARAVAGPHCRDRREPGSQ